MENKVEIKWLGHSCFKVTYEGASLVIDPYDFVEGYPPLKTSANMVLCSHGHGDHSYVKAVDIEPYIKPEIPLSARTVKSFHDPEGGRLRGENLIHIISAGDFRIVHLGDLGHLLSLEQIEEIGKCDVLMVPVGGFYTIDGNEAKKVCDSLSPRVIIPMHYRRGGYGFEAISGPEIFTANYPADFVHETGTNVLELTDETPSQVAVMTFKG